MTPKRHKFSARVFLVAGIYGVVVILPQYFLEEKTGPGFPATAYSSRAFLRFHRRRTRLAIRVSDYRR